LQRAIDVGNQLESTLLCIPVCLRPLPSLPSLPVENPFQRIHHCIAVSNNRFGAVAYLESGLWRNDVVAAASSDGGPTGGRGPRQFYFILNQRGGALT